MGIKLNSYLTSSRRIQPLMDENINLRTRMIGTFAIPIRRTDRVNRQRLWTQARQVNRGAGHRRCQKRLILFSLLHDEVAYYVRRYRRTKKSHPSHPGELWQNQSFSGSSNIQFDSRSLLNTRNQANLWCKQQMGSVITSSVS